MASTLIQGSGPVIAHEHNPSCKRDPLAIPEILASIGEHMDRQTLCVSIRVSRLWNPAFLPFLWSTILIHDLARLPFETVETHVRYICELTLMDDVDQRYGTDLFCPKLARLTIKSFLSLETYYRTPLFAFTDLIRRHQHTLRSVRFTSPITKDLWAALECCTQLEDLFISQLKLTDPAEWLSLYDRIWSRLTVLHLYGDWTPSELPEALLLQPLENSRPLAKIQDLAILRDNFNPDERQRDAQTQVQGWIIQQSRSLVKCDWSTWEFDQDKGVVKQLAERLLSSGQDLWPQLESLRLAQEFRGTDFAVLMDGLTRLTELRMLQTNFDDFCWNAIERNSRHLASLRTLVISKCPLVTGKILQAMMASLPNLELLEAEMLEDKDILDDDRPWICVRLKILRVIIVLGLQESQPMILERLSRLVQLEECRLYGDDSSHSLDLTLEKGLDQLRTLKQLQHFQVGNSQRKTRWGKEEVQWTQDHWPRLKELFGVVQYEDIDHSLT